ncbi:MAG: endonuclease/exonuclease/phosphatase family protein [Armatimonadota bacterium]|nr:endonuclease/exonuclease/phosphatase family protein [Armatimonadota bacterium]
MSHEREGRTCCCSGCVLRLITLAAVAIVAGVWGLQRYPGEDWWLGALVTWGPQAQWIIPPALALVLTAAAREGRLTLINLAATAVALFVLAGFEINWGPDVPEGRPIVRVATWNVHGRTEDRQTVRDRILNWDCDVVCLQEAGRRAFNDLLPGYEDARARDLRVFVRGRIRGHEVIRTERHRVHPLLRVEAEIGGQPLTVIALHIPRVRRSRRMPREVGPLAEYLREGRQVREEKFAHLLEVLPEEGPLLVAGDMNTPPTSRYWRSVDAHLTDAFEAVGRGFGFTFVWRRRLPMLRIDYVWAGGRITPVRCWVETAVPSDHRPVLAEVALPAADEAPVMVHSTAKPPVQRLRTLLSVRRLPLSGWKPDLREG